MTRKEILKQYWETAYEEHSKRFPFEKVLHPTWLKEYRPVKEVITEMTALAEMQINNLKMLQTEAGRNAYIETSNLHLAIIIDNKNQTMDTNTDKKELLERTFLVQCTKEQLIALGDWMNEHDVFFCKCSDEINRAAHKYTFSDEEAETEETDGAVRP